MYTHVFPNTLLTNYIEFNKTSSSVILEFLTTVNIPIKFFNFVLEFRYSYELG